ncbi:unnamed protein product [Larinioides sclopetarius]|uniref:Uncharacterized protein n=1 Tax=Larinioides sclopetarius TaxID=280406 RepID=A0AAV1ZCT3_9ARAC
MMLASDPQAVYLCYSQHQRKLLKQQSRESDKQTAEELSPTEIQFIDGQLFSIAMKRHFAKRHSKAQTSMDCGTSLQKGVNSVPYQEANDAPVAFPWSHAISQIRNTTFDFLRHYT